MAKFTVTHEINCDEETFWKLFFSRTFNARMYSEVFKFPAFEIVDEQDDGNLVIRKAAGRPRVQALPDAVQKLLGSNFGYVEESVFDKTKKTWRWKMMPTHLSDRLCNVGHLRLEPDGAGRVLRIAEVTVEARIFGLGRFLEGVAEKELRSGWDQSAAFLNKWLAENPVEVRARALLELNGERAAASAADRGGPPQGAATDKPPA